MVIGLALITGSCTPPQQVSLYYYDPSLDLDANGNVQCSEAGLVSVQREVAATLSETALIGETIQLLIAGELTADERVLGITTEYPLDGLILEDVLLDSGTLTLTFSDPNHLTSGGACSASILWLQIEWTGLQFAGVSDVQFEPEDVFQP